MLYRRRRSINLESSTTWATAVLEPRCMLAGDVGEAIDSVPAYESTRPHATGELSSCGHLVFVDPNVPDLEAVLAGVSADSELILLDPELDGLEQIHRQLSDRRNSVESIHLIAHGESGAIKLGNQVIDRTQLLRNESGIRDWKSALTSNADVLLYGCDIAQGERGQQFIRCLAELSGADVAASTDQTGSVEKGGDWILEQATGTIGQGLRLTPDFRQTYRGLLPIQIRMAGETKEERVQLRIDGQTVRTFTAGGNASAGEFLNYTYDADDIDVSRIQLHFVNDLYDPTAGIDRNVRVDRIIVDGISYQTEASNVLSTGTWTAADGVQSGFGRGEYLHSNGYFQYGVSGTSIDIRARGETGEESMSLLIDEQIVQTWENVSSLESNYRYTFDGDVSSDRIRIQFNNDVYEPPVDRNLTVDWIELNGRRIETESPTVFSTGTWLPSDSISPGFGRGETLHTNGYFQFGAGGAESGAFALATSIIDVNESSGTATVTVNRVEGSGTEATIEYRTESRSAVAGDDFTSVDGTLTFRVGEISKTVEIPIIVDGVSEGTESFAFTIDNPSGAGLRAPRTATITINDLVQPNYDDFADVSGLQLNGSASQSGDRLQLTGLGALQAGSAYYQTPVPVNSDTSFQSRFAFQTAGGPGGADGLAFVLQGNSPTALGDAGGFLGYRGVQNSLAIEFDTYGNPGEINDNHVSVLINGSTTAPVATRTLSTNLNDGNVKYAWVDYNGTTNVLAVYVSENDQKPGRPVLVTSVDLQSQVGEQAFVGFSAGTGIFANSHDILNWEFDTTIPPIPTDPAPGNILLTNTLVDGLFLPTSLDFTSDGDLMFVAEQRGIVTAYRDGVQVANTLDFTDRINGTRDRGLLDIAVHPDLTSNPYLYLLYTYDPPEVNEQPAGTLAGPDGNGNRAGRLTRVTLDAASGYTTIVPDSEVVLIGKNSVWENFNAFVNSNNNFAEPPAGILPDGSNIQDFIATDGESHTVGSVEFGPNGALYVSIGDGASYNQVDVRALRVQDIDNLSGKILRVDPITGQGLGDNPFYDGDPDSNRSKVFQYGLRNPFRISVDDATGRVYVGDVGWTSWEEINTGAPGTNFGWPFYEGATDFNAPTGGYSALPEAAAFYQNNNAIPSILSVNHTADGINAIVLGDVYNGNQYPEEYQGDLFFNDLGGGLVRNISFDENGEISGVQAFTTGAQFVVQIVSAPDGFLYFVDLDNGTVGRWEFV